jgi:hypothetical protein
LQYKGFGLRHCREISRRCSLNLSQRTTGRAVSPCGDVRNAQGELRALRWDNLDVERAELKGLAR